MADHPLRNAPVVLSPDLRHGLASRVSERETSLADEPTDPIGLAEVDHAPQQEDDLTQEFRARRSIWLPLVCVSGLLVGFSVMLAVLGLPDPPAQSDLKQTPTTVASAAPTSAAPAMTAPASSASSSAAPRDLPPSTPAPPAPTPAAAPAPATAPVLAPPSVSAPDLNPAGHAPPGRSR